MFYYLLFCLLILSNKTFASEDDFNEELFLRQLPTGQVYSVFQFTTHLNENIFDNKISPHFDLFPKSFAEIISAYNIVELHLSLTQGRWRYNHWGYPVENAPVGIALWIWFHPDMNKTTVDNNWKGVVHALSGQFCSSLNFINKEFTASPILSFKPLGLWLEQRPNAEDHLRYASLPQETVCTENLTPWKKLLPCGDRSGIASLLDPLQIFDSSYVSLGVHLRSVCEKDGCTIPKLELKQTISSVFETNFEDGFSTWSLRKLLGRKLRSACPLATTSTLLIDLNDKNIKQHSLTPVTDKRMNISFDQDLQHFHVYDLAKTNFSTPFDVKVSVEFYNTVKSVPSVLVHKYTTGYGLEMGGIVCLITNTLPKSIKVVYLDVIPYYVRVYLHTLKIRVGDMEIKPEKIHFLPGYRGKHPASIELLLTIPAMSTATVTIEFEKVFLDWMQYRPDAHHGHYIGSSVISVYFPVIINNAGISEQCSLFSTADSCTVGMDSKKGIFRRIFSEPLLIRVPLPDFSMPYNVLCLTCTVIAIGFGSIYNICTKTFEVEPDRKKKTIKENVALLKEKITSSLGMVKRKLFPSKEHVT